jgi:hypothetical protein
MCVRRSGSATCTWSAGGKLLLEYQNDALTGEASGELEDGSQYQGELIERVYPPQQIADEGTPPNVQEQHACLDLAKNRRWDELEARLRASSHPRCLINSQPSGRWPALHQVLPLARQNLAGNTLKCFPAVIRRRRCGGAQNRGTEPLRSLSLSHTLCHTDTT